MLASHLAAGSRGSLAGKVAIVTGSSMGIGQAIAEALASEGAFVVIHSSSSVEQGQAVAKQLGGTYIQADVSNEQDCIR